MVIVILLLFVVIAAYLLFRKKDKPVGSSSGNAGQNFTALLQEHVAYYRNLDKPGKIRFETLIVNFLNDTTIEGVGTAVTDIDRVLIASSAVIPIFGFPEWRYRNLTNVILYPDTFDKNFQFEGDERNILGMVGTGYMNGQMILSRAALTKGFSASAGKENAAIHEFVHLLDKSEGETDGVPENLLAHQYTVPWLHMIHQEMHRIQAGKSDINPYGLTNEAEFFAVASEYFFEKPQELHKKHPALYELLSLAFGQQPA
jgi:Mlc titration factor MtfA (ptsG expression regulator)